MIAVLSYFYIVPGGKITYSYDFSKGYYNLLGGKGFIHKLGPSERIADKNKIIADPAYFYARAPRNFSTAKVKLSYGLSSQVLEKNNIFDVQVGVLVDKDNWRYQLQPIFNSFLDNIPSGWCSEEVDDLYFLLREPCDITFDDFMAEDDFSSTAFYNYSVPYNYIIPSYSPWSDDNYIEVSNIKGSYSFYTYIKSEDLKIDFNFSDFNRNLAIFVYFQDSLIFSQYVDEVDYILNVADLPEGAYRVEVRADDSLITEKLTSSNSKLVFINKIWLTDQEDEIIVFSNKDNFRFKAWDNNSLGDVYINNELLLIDRIYQQFNFKINEAGDLNMISSGLSGMLVENNGLFSFSEDSFFDPVLKRLDSSLNLDNIDYILARYSQGEVVLDLSSAFRDKDGYHFIISAPFLDKLSDDEYIEIKKIEISLQGGSLSEKIKRLLNFKTR